MFPAANPVGVFGVITPDICNIIPNRPIIDPPATSPIMKSKVKSNEK